MTDDSLYGGRVLLLAAVEDELGDDAADLARRCDLVFTGVGKLRAFEATLAALSRHDYAAVVNVGTCGSLVHRTGTVLRPSEVWQGGLYIDSVFASEPERVASAAPVSRSSRSITSSRPRRRVPSSTCWRVTTASRWRATPCCVRCVSMPRSTGNGCRA